VTTDVVVTIYKSILFPIFCRMKGSIRSYTYLVSLMLYIFRNLFISCRVTSGLRGKFSFGLQREFVKRTKLDLGMEGFVI
jgi:hypothetical protein